MPTVKYNEVSVVLDDSQSVLDGLNNAGLSIPFSCRAGLCHACILQADSEPPVFAQQGLTENQKAQNFFLACSCFPKSDMSVNKLGVSAKSRATVIEKRMLNKSVLGLFLQIDFAWMPGQYLTLWRDDLQGRSYSIANRCESDKVIELHIKRHDQGIVSPWLHDEIKLSDILYVSKPIGNCFYTIDTSDKPMLLVSTGTGLAPLMGILKEAIAHNHNAPIYLYSGAGDPDGLYYRDELTALAEAHKNFYYIPSVRRLAKDDVSLLQADVVDLVKERHSDLKGWKAFLCGSEMMIKQVQRHCFFQGVTVDDILVDAFIINKPEK